MKTIEYDPLDYEIIDTIEYNDGDLFQKVQFKSGHYGVVYVTHDKDKKYYDVIFVGTDKGDAYVDVFLEFARSQTEVINKIHEKVDKVTLVVQLNKDESEIFEQVISKDEANDLIERLKIANEIIAMHEEDNWFSFDRLSVILFICILINLASAAYNFKGGL